MASLEAALDAALTRPSPPARTFADLGLPHQLVSALAGRGVCAPFAIQAHTLPDGLSGRDVLGRAETGGGKTLAFGLPMLSRLAEATTPPTPAAPRGLILVPTRELASQVSDVLTPLARAVRLRVAAVYGGTAIGRQIQTLAGGEIDIVVATPGRLIDLMERRAVSLQHIEIGVLDEADHMADLGFLPAVTRILDATPSGRQLMLFSATLDRGVGVLVTRYLREPAVHAVAPATAPVAAMAHRVFVLRSEDRLAVASEIASRPSRTLFFVRTKHGAARLAKQLNRAGTDATAIHGNLNQNQRQRALDNFTNGHNRVLVATDVAARGLHVDDLDLVVHYDPPADAKAYLHRSGRTARAGASGTVVSLVDRSQIHDVEKIHALASVTATTASVTAGHASVQQLANSGEAVTAVHTSTPPRAATSTRRRQARRPGRQSAIAKSDRTFTSSLIAHSATKGATPRPRTNASTAL